MLLFSSIKFPNSFFSQLSILKQNGYYKIHRVASFQSLKMSESDKDRGRTSDSGIDTLRKSRSGSGSFEEAGHERSSFDDYDSQRGSYDDDVDVDDKKVDLSAFLDDVPPGDDVGDEDDEEEEEDEEEDDEEEDDQEDEYETEDEEVAELAPGDELLAGYANAKPFLFYIV